MMRSKYLNGKGALSFSPLFYYLGRSDFGFYLWSAPRDIKKGLWFQSIYINRGFFFFLFPFGDDERPIFFLYVSTLNRSPSKFFGQFLLITRRLKEGLKKRNQNDHVGGSPPCIISYIVLPLHTNSLSISPSLFFSPSLPPSPSLIVSNFQSCPLTFLSLIASSLTSSPGVFLLASHRSIQDVSNREIIMKMNLKVRFWFIKEIIRVRKCLI